MKYQRRNIETWGDHGIFFTYEQMCEKPEQVEQMISELVPELNDLTLRQRIKVRNYNEVLRNMNEQQINRLAKDDICRINEVFSKHQDVFDFFRYSLYD